MEKSRHETVIHSEVQNAMNGNEAATSVPPEGQEKTQNESDPGPMERTKEVMEDIGFMINSI